MVYQYGEEHVPEVERLWSALCSWQNNLRITINSLARLTCACGNMSAMVQQAKRIMVSFSRTHATAIIVELIRDLQVHVLGSGCIVMMYECAASVSGDNIS